MAHHRRLPHIYPEGASLFITFCLHGSANDLLLPPAGAVSGETFVWLDRQLDGADRGPLCLRRPEIARVVDAAIHKGAQLGHYELHGYVVMSNHVHLLIRPMIAPDRLLKSLKGSSAREANRLLGRTGEPFWQKESYDHWVRNRTEFLKIRAYIYNNPMKAGLVANPEDFPWSSAGVETSLDGAR